MATLSQSSWQYPYDTYNKLYLENTKAGHRKFYEMSRTGSGWTARWGKIGTSGQTMYYESSLWGDKLSEKMKKGYVLERADSSTPKPQGTPPPIVRPRKPDPDILVDAEVMAKLDRIEIFLDDKGKLDDSSKVSAIKAEYIRTGVLTKKDMERLNNFWIRNGGGKW